MPACLSGDQLSSQHFAQCRTKFGERAFAVAGPAAWNSLTFNICNSSTLNSFKTALKTFMFSLEYCLFQEHFSAFSVFFCTAPLNQLLCYGALEIVVVSLLLNQSNTESEFVIKLFTDYLYTILVNWLRFINYFIKDYFCYMFILRLLNSIC